MCIHDKLRRMLAKDVGIRIRVERELREAFRNACLAENRDASDVLREFMRKYAEQHNNGRQGDLFSPLVEKVHESSKRTHDEEYSA